jgi:hypothetical protein
LFEQQTALICRASELLDSGLISGYEGACKISREMTALEEQGDCLVKQIIQRLQKTFLTPFEPQDVQDLATVLDDVLDSIENATFLMVAYRLEPIPRELADFGRIVHASCISLQQALGKIVRRESVTENCIAVGQLEREADLLARRLMCDLFRTERDPITLLKHKEMFEKLETITDRCDDAANLLEGVSICSG